MALVAVVNGFSAFIDAWSDLHPAWLALTLGCELLAAPAYVVLYRIVAQLEGGPRAAIPLLTRLVIAGFGPFAPDGGFALDKRALQALEEEGERYAVVRVLGIGALEWALLAPAAWVSALVLLITADPKPMPSLLRPWVIAVPVGFAIGLWLAVPDRVERLREGTGRSTSRTSCSRGRARAPAGVPDPRSMPLGGAGVTELLMTASLHWVGQPIAPALAAVVVYGVFNFVLPAVPALLVRRRLRPLLQAGEEDRAPTRAERRRAAARGLEDLLEHGLALTRRAGPRAGRPPPPSAPGWRSRSPVIHRGEALGMLGFAACISPSVSVSSCRRPCS